MKPSGHSRHIADGKHRKKDPNALHAEERDEIFQEPAPAEDEKSPSVDETAASLEPEAKSPEQLFDQAQEEVDSLRNQLIRLQADFQNFRTRARKSEAEGVSLGVEKLAEAIYPILDEFEIALRHIEDPSSREGVEMIRDHLEEALRKNGIQCFDPSGELFDPNRHFAVLVEKREGIDQGIIIETLKKGYARGEKVLQPAMVKVSQ